MYIIHQKAPLWMFSKKIGFQDFFLPKFKHRCSKRIYSTSKLIFSILDNYFTLHVCLSFCGYSRVRNSSTGTFNNFWDFFPPILSYSGQYVYYFLQLKEVGLCSKNLDNKGNNTEDSFICTKSNLLFIDWDEK